MNKPIYEQDKETLVKTVMSQAVEHSERVVLVDEQDQVVGTEEKMRAHELGLLHRAFSVFVYRRGEKGLEFLLQKRHSEKYHCGGLWTNTCCSHPRLNESIVEAGERRLREEMSLAIALRHVGSFIYRASFSNGLTEHEFDHVLIGEYNGKDPIVIDPLEVEEYRWMDCETLQKELSNQTLLYTPWIKPALHIALEGL
jgi:isopentenyl-diphosphate delta-isomerase type 1